MNQETLQELLLRHPFEPFAVRLSNGEAFEVRHPEMAFVTKSRLVVGQADSDRVTICSLIHINSIEMLQAA